MTRKIGALLILSLAFALCADGQTAVQILQKTIDKIGSLRSVSYEINSVNKNPFSNGDTSFSKSYTSLDFDSKGLLKAMDKRTDINPNQMRSREIYRKDTLFSIDLNDSTYSIDIHPKNVYSGLNSFVDLVKGDLAGTRSKIIRKKDTVFAGISCYSIFIKGYDSIENNHHNYTYQYLLINKNTLMPVYTKQIGAGDAEKGGYSLGRLEFYNEDRFLNFKFYDKAKALDAEFERSKFDLANEKMLEDGAIAPDITVKDLAKDDVPVSKFKNKIVLIEFGATSCGANPLANPLMNRLNKKYNSADIAIISVYSEETPEQIKMYINSNKLEFPVYMGNRKLKKEFKTMGTPGFYLINKDGKVVKSSNGYSDELERDLTTQIDNLLGQL